MGVTVPSIRKNTDMHIRNTFAAVAAGVVVIGSLALGAAPAQAGYNSIEGPFTSRSTCLYYQNALKKDDSSIRISKQCWASASSGRQLWYFNYQS